MKLKLFIRSGLKIKSIFGLFYFKLASCSDVAPYSFLIMAINPSYNDKNRRVIILNESVAY
jgi:hypothetical protein